MSVFDTHDVLVKQDRYDELLRKENLLETIKTLHEKLTDYAFRDAVGHLLKTAISENDEEA